MLAAAFHTSRHYILFTALVCLCVLLGGCFAGAAGLIAPAMAWLAKKPRCNRVARIGDVSYV